MTRRLDRLAVVRFDAGDRPGVRRFFFPLAAQAPTGRIVGRMVDAETGRGIRAGIQIVGTTTGTMSGIEGRYTIADVPAGTVTIQVRPIGYAPRP